MADGYVQLGQTAKARELYTSLVSDYKDDDIGTAAAKKLEELK